MCCVWYNLSDTMTGDIMQCNDSYPTSPPPEISTTASQLDRSSIKTVVFPPQPSAVKPLHFMTEMTFENWVYCCCSTLFGFKTSEEMWGVRLGLQCQMWTSPVIVVRKMLFSFLLLLKCTLYTVRPVHTACYTNCTLTFTQGCHRKISFYPFLPTF